MRISGGFILASATFLLSSVTTPTWAADLRVNGAATIARVIIIPNQAAIEQETGLKLTVTVNGDGNGLLDLYAGRADVAMIAAPAKATEAVLNKTTPGAIVTEDFEMTPVGTAEIQFVVNPKNPVRTLSPDQLRDILTGKITSWKEVGGDDIPILVVAEVPGFGTHTNIVATFLNGTEFSPRARLMQALVQLVQVTAQAPGAISYGNSASIDDSVAVLPGMQIKQELGLVTKGKPTPEEAKLIAAVAKYGMAAK
jgi:phosphate transport system substrate-binding protein